MSLPMFPKPKDIKKEPVAVKVFPSGREVCNQLYREGRDEYARRKRVMWERQDRKCGLQISPQCKQHNGRWPFDEIQFGHEVSRGGGKQDDRIEVLDLETGKMKRQNRALCSWCNSLQGSRPMSDFEEVVP